MVTINILKGFGEGLIDSWKEQLSEINLINFISCIIGTTLMCAVIVPFIFMGLFYDIRFRILYLIEGLRYIRDKFLEGIVGLYYKLYYKV